MRRALFIITAIVLSNNSCVMHQVNVEGDLLGAAPLLKSFEDRSDETLPIQLHLDEAGRNVRPAPTPYSESYINRQLVANYFSGDIVQSFRASRHFRLDSGANVVIIVRPELLEFTDKDNLTQIPFFLTLGTFPGYGDTKGMMGFTLFDRQRREIIKEYRYPVKHRFLVGWAIALAGPVFALVSERFSMSSNERNPDLSQVVFNQFEADLRSDLARDETLLTHFTIGAKPVYAIGPVEAEEDYAISTRRILEGHFVRSGAIIVEREQMDLVLDELAHSQSGLTESARNRLGHQLNVDRLVSATLTVRPAYSSSYDAHLTVRCISVETNRILWSIEVEDFGLSPESAIDRAMEEIMQELHTKARI
ncbi:MAG: hypothetical protein KDK34_03640 [Leptospiraceae bacterium]|nr:hypothetical protein [Leptospiraceae bacterium]